MKILIDTNRYSDFAKGEKTAVETFTTADRIFVPFVVVAELRAGFRSGTISQRNEAVLVRFLGFLFDIFDHCSLVMLYIFLN